MRERMKVAAVAIDGAPAWRLGDGQDHSELTGARAAESRPGLIPQPAILVLLPLSSLHGSRRRDIGQHQPAGRRASSSFILS